MTSSSSNQSKFQAHTSPSPTCVRSFPTSDQPEIKEHSSMVSPVHSPKDTKQTNHLEVSPSSQNKDQELRSLCVEKCRDIILDLMHPMNRLCQAVRTANHASVPSEDALDAMAQLFSGLLLLAKTMGVNLRDAIHHKMDLNKQKYPVKLCKVCRISDRYVKILCQKSSSHRFLLHRVERESILITVRLQV